MSRLLFSLLGLALPGLEGAQGNMTGHLARTQRDLPDPMARPQMDTPGHLARAQRDLPGPLARAQRDLPGPLAGARVHNTLLLHLPLPMCRSSSVCEPAPPSSFLRVDLLPKPSSYSIAQPEAHIVLQCIASYLLQPLPSSRLFPPPPFYSLLPPPASHPPPGSDLVVPFLPMQLFPPSPGARHKRDLGQEQQQLYMWAEDALDRWTGMTSQSARYGHT